MGILRIISGALLGFWLTTSVVCQQARAEQYQGIIHAHTTYSDNKTLAGLDVLQDLAAADGYKFVFLTDHIDMMDKSFDKYVQRCWWLDQDRLRKRLPTMLAGEEFSLAGDSCHALILGLMYEDTPGHYWRLSQADGKDPQWLVSAVSRRCAVLKSDDKPAIAAIIAHPHEWGKGKHRAIAAEAIGFTSVELINNTGIYFDKLKSELLERTGQPPKLSDLWMPSYFRRVSSLYPNAERAANVVAADADSFDLDYYLELMKLDKAAGHCLLLGVTGGSDAHVTAYFDRTTRLFANGRSVNELLNAILCRRTYASYGSCRIASLTHPMGLARPYTADEAKMSRSESDAGELVPLQNRVLEVAFGCQIVFPSGTDCDVRVYRDGVDCTDQAAIEHQTNGVRLDLKDSDAEPGKVYAYNIVVRDKSVPRIYLATSPFLFYVRPTTGKGSTIIGSAGSDWRKKLPGSVPGAKEAGKVDLVFCIDATSSMRDDIDEVKRRAGDIISRLRAEVPDLRLGLVTYRDFAVDGAEHLSPKDFVPLTDDLDAVNRRIQGIEVAGGGDTPEDVIDGLMKALDMKWRNGVGKFVILIGDAPAKDPDHNGRTYDDAAKRAAEVDPAHIFGIVAGTSEEVRDDFTKVASATGGYVLLNTDASKLPDAIVEITKKAIETHKSEVYGGGGGAEPEYTGPVIVLVVLSLMVLVAVSVLAVKTFNTRKRSQAVMTSAPRLTATIYDFSQRRSVRIGAQPLLIGRSSQCRLRLTSPDVSRRHALIAPQGPAYVIRDLGSQSGIFVNDVQCSQQVLRNGDRIRVGSVELMFNLDRAR